MNRLLRNAILISLLAWLAGAAGAVQSRMQCPIGWPSAVERTSPAGHAYARASRRDRLQEWRKRRQEWRAQRRWSAPRNLALRPPPPMSDPLDPPARGWTPRGLQELPGFEAPRGSHGLDLQPSPGLEPPRFPERFPAPPSFPDYPAFARLVPPPGYWHGPPPLSAYPLPPPPWSAASRRAIQPESVSPDQALKEVRSRAPGYGQEQPDDANLTLKGGVSHWSARRIEL